jgi:AraC family transcriptional regulator, positive regulator of tynA and feaB
MYDAYSLTTQPPKDRFEFFRGVVEEIFYPMGIQPGGPAHQPFGGNVSVGRLRDTLLAHIATSPCIVRRRPEDIARDGTTTYLVKFQMKGQSVWTQRGRDVHLRPGDFAICSAVEPYTLRLLESYSMPVLGLSSQAMEDLVCDPEQFLGVRMNGTDPDCGLLSSFVAQVAARMNQLTQPLRETAETSILHLLGAVLTARARKKSQSAAQLLQAIKVYVHKHLADQRLGPAMIAAELRISPRYVHTLFRDEPMTLGHYIRASRLQACREALENDPSRVASLTNLALSLGFYDLSHMSRGFREEFKTTPKEVWAQSLQRARSHSAHLQTQDSSRSAEGGILLL